MTELERYKKAYATLVGHVDTIIGELRDAGDTFYVKEIGLELAACQLTEALLEAEEIIVGD